MTDELRNRAWEALPQEFKKEVVNTFNKLDNSANNETLTRGLKRRYRHQKEALGYLFGYDNLFWKVNNETNK